jgi:hypothetical protein
VNIQRNDIDTGFARETKVIVDETVEELKRIQRGDEPTPPGMPQCFLIVSKKTRFIISQPLADKQAFDMDGILLSIYDFINEQPGLEEGNIYLTKLKEDSILIETFGATLFAQVFSRDIDRSHYKSFHRTVRHLQGSYPHLNGWDGTPDGVPLDLRRALRLHFQIASEPGPAVAAPAAEPGDTPGPARPIIYREEPDIQDCERKMKEWYKKGYNIDRLKGALHGDWGTIVDTFDAYEKDIGRLEKLRERVSELELPGFEEDLRKIKPLLNDPSNLENIETALAAMARKAKERLGIHLPVIDKKTLTRAIRDLPLGIPSALWGIPLGKLGDDFLSAERGLTPDGSAVVNLRSHWYHADPRGKLFMTPFSGPVRTQKDLSESGNPAAQMDQMLDEILNGK